MNYGYELIDPRDNLPFYVGITNKPKLRLRQHLMIDPSNYYKTDRIQNILEDGLKPLMRVIFEEEENAVARQMEKDKIAEYVSSDIYLSNLDYVQPRERGLVRKSAKRTASKSLITVEVEHPVPVPAGYLTAKEAVEILKVDAHTFSRIKSMFTTADNPYFLRDKVEGFAAHLLNPFFTHGMRKAFLAQFCKAKTS